MRRVVTLCLLVVLIASSAGCVENMDRFKELLGAKKAPPEPVYEAPLARAQANATSVLAGAPVRFTSEGSKDPQGLALEFSWQLGPFESSKGPVVVHAFAKPGEYVVKLKVANSAGLSDEDQVTVQVRAPNSAPEAAFSILDAEGRAATSAEAGAKLTFDASGSTDPDGDALAYDWDFGDGATSHEARATKSFEKPGLYTVRLTLTDPAGLKAHASRLVAINATHTFQDSFDVTGGDKRSHAFALPEGVASLQVSLRFDAGAGVNDLEIVLKDADGKVVAQSAADTPPGAQGEQVRQLPPLTSDALKAHKSGEWSVEVAREKGVKVSYQLVVRETF